VCAVSKRESIRTSADVTDEDWGSRSENLETMRPKVAGPITPLKLLPLEFGQAPWSMVIIKIKGMLCEHRSRSPGKSNEKEDGSNI